MFSKPMIMVIRCSQKNFCFLVATAFGLLFLRFLLPDLEFISSYANAIRQTKGTDHVYKQNVHVTATSKQKSDQKSQQQDPCLRRYIYMHDGPPRFNDDLVMKCETLRNQYNFCPYVENEGFGQLLSLNDSSEGSESIVLGKSCYVTHQLILEMIFHTRMKKYECLTSNSSLASAIYVPFYSGLELTQYLWGGFNASVKDAGGLDFTTWLKGRPEWTCLFGWDHFFVGGRITWDFRRSNGSNWGSNLMNLPETKNMTMLTIESCPYADDDFAIPYPTYFHPSNDSEILHWQQRVRRAKRSHLFAFAGATRPYSTSIRDELISQCKEASRNRCKLVSCLPNDTVNCNSPNHIINGFMMSDFCLQPPGDSNTRRSTFDAILAGCIPVFFHPGSAYTQYFWHLPENYTSYSVFIPEQGIKNSTVSVENVLSQISQGTLSDMREQLIVLIPKVIYGRTKLQGIDDAFDIAVKRVLQRIDVFRKHIQEGKDPQGRFSEELTWKYYLKGKVRKHKWDYFFQNKQKCQAQKRERSKM